MSDLLDKIKSGRDYRTMQMIASEEADSYNVRGYATTFEAPYVLLQDGNVTVMEVVDRNAFEGCDMDDVIMQYDHTGRVFARTSNDTLKLSTDDHGLLVNAYLGGTEIGRGLYGEIKGGYTSKMSFGFRVADDAITSEEKDDKVVYTRRIKRFQKLYDVSAVSLPANDGTEISARSLRDGEIAKLEAERLLEAERRNAVETLKNKINTILGKAEK